MECENQDKLDRKLDKGFDAPGLYLHIPFCTRKCAYCDFASGVFPREIQTAYLFALKREFKKRSELFPSGFKTIYVGGGSPSCLKCDQWFDLVMFLRCCVEGQKYSEFTVEMNPSQVTEEKLSSLQGLATRISLGAQTFEPYLRKTLGREPVDPACVERALQMIRGRFDINIDLIHSIPGQTIEHLERDLFRTAGPAVDHVSAYALILEEGTLLQKRVQRGEVQLPGEDFEIEALSLVRKRLEERGFLQYEISNFARPQKECRHNLSVWAGCEYLGIGASACSYVGVRRTRNEPDVRTYIELIGEKAEAICESEILDEKKRAGELAMLNLRTRSGICNAYFKSITGFDPMVLFKEPIKHHSDAGLIETTGTHIRLTEEGLDLANRVMIDFLQ